MEFKLQSGKVTLIDEDDLELLEKYRWLMNDNGYVYRNLKIDGVKKIILLHRYLVNAPKGLVVDHINGNPSDNRKSNLRICTQAQNSRNSSKTPKPKASSFKGVYPTAQKYRSTITFENEKINLGNYETEVEAAIAYNMKASELFGDFARLNVIPDEYANIIPKKTQLTSGYRGVYFDKKSGRWAAKISRLDNIYFLGYFENEDDAALAYNVKALELLGDRAILNNLAF